MTTFVAIYRGDTPETARVIAMTANPEICAELALRLISEDAETTADPVIRMINQARHEALRLLIETQEEAA